MSGLIDLRPYQLDGVDRLRQRTVAGVARILFVLATGGGKTIIAAHIISGALELGSRSLFVAHRIELIRQSFCKLARNGIPVERIGIIMGDTPSAKAGELFEVDISALSDDEIWNRFARRRPGAPVQVASIDTLRVRAKLGNIDLIIIDEAHRALARSYVDLVAAHPGAVVIGLTATPYRADGKGLEELFDELVVIARPRLLIDEGFLVEPEVWRPGAAAPKPDMSAVKIKGGDYESSSLSAAVDRVELIGDLVDHWLRHANGVRTVVFAASVDHSKRIAARFVEAGIRAEHLDGETPTAERAAILRRLDRGETLIVSNCAVLCEGWDQPSVKCCILARPTKSTGLYLQCAGRIRRPWNGERAIILDHAGCSLEHGLPQDDREFSLAGDAKKRANAGARARECPKCGFVVPLGTPQCNGCGYIFQPTDAGAVELVEVAGQLVRADASQDERDRLLWDSIVAEWQAKNAKRAIPLKPGWCHYRFKGKAAGRRPPSGCELPKLDPALVERAERLEAVAQERGYSDKWKHVAAARDIAPVAITPPAPAPEPEPAPSMQAPRAPWERKRGHSKPPATKTYTPEELEEVTL